MRPRLITLAIALLIAPGLPAQGTGRAVGAVLKGDCVAMLGMNKPGKTPVRLKAGTFMAFLKMEGGFTPKWGDYKTDGDNIRAVVLQNNDSGFTEYAWLPEDKVEFFQYDSEAKSRTPFQNKGLKTQWSLSFKFAAKATCKELGIKPASAAFEKAPEPEPAEDKKPPVKSPRGR